MTPVHFGTKRRFWLLRGFGGILLAAASMAFLRANPGSVAGWVGLVGVILFGIGGVIGLVQGTRRGPRLTIDDQGVNDRTLGVGVIPWDDIAGVSVYGLAQEPRLALNLRNPAKYVARASGVIGVLARRHLASGFPPFSINLAGLDADPDRVIELIESRARGAGLRTGTPGDSDALDGIDDSADLDDDLDDAEPPEARRVAQRAFVLAAVARRSALEDDATGGDADAATYAETVRREMLAWLAAVGALDEAEREERRLLEAPLGSLDAQRTTDAGWRSEGLGVLAWALRRSELPSYQDTVRPADVAGALGFMSPAGAALLSAAALREAEELETLAARLFALHWRLREFSLRPRHMDFATFARTAPFGPLIVTGLQFADGDLAIDGRPLARVAEERWRQCMSIAQERQQAANWLCGYGRVYSEVTADT